MLLLNYFPIKATKSGRRKGISVEAGQQWLNLIAYN